MTMIAVPLSAEQRSMLFYDELFGLGVADNNVVVVTVDGEVSESDIVDALAVIVDRHAALRAALDGESPGTLAFASQQAPVLTKYPDVVPDDPQWTLRRIGELAEVRMHRSQPLLVRFELVERATADRSVILTIDHLISDATSCGIILAEFAQLLRRGTRLSPLPMSFDELCRARGNSARLGALLRQETEYWRCALNGVTPLTNVTRSTGPTRDQTRVRHDLLRQDAVVHQRLRKLVGMWRTTPFVAVATVFAIVLWKRTGNTDFMIFTPVSTRHDPALAQLVGNFVNDRPIPCRVNPNATMACLAQEIDHSRLGALQHHRAAIPDLVGEVEPLRTALLSESADYIQLHVDIKDTDTGEEWPALPADWQREVLGGFTPSMSVGCTTLRFTVEPNRAWVKAFCGGPLGVDAQVAALVGEVMRMLESAEVQPGTRVGEFAGE